MFEMPARSSDATRPSSTSNTQRRAVSYARTASPTPDGIRTQHEGNRRAAEADGYRIVDEFSDIGVSGATSDRAALRQLLAEAATGAAPFSRVYVADRSRLGRWADWDELPNLLATLMQQGVDVVCAGKAALAPDDLANRLAACTREGVDDSVRVDEAPRVCRADAAHETAARVEGSPA